ncbi:hypothetical protein CY34DRAFT_68943, partial [Suillus luteus UH-Slu-Lm8-n1]
VVRKTLRLRAPVTWTMSIAAKDDQISVAKPFLDQSEEPGNLSRLENIITILIQANNKDIWGEDVYSFRHTGLTVERWQNPPEQVKDILGLCSDVETSLNGSHGYVGF